MKNSATIIMGLIGILLVVGAFFCGMKYQESRQLAGGRGPQTGQMGRTGRGQFGGGANGSGRQGFRPLNGEIIGTDATSITVKLMDGSSKIVLVSDKTEVNKATQVKKDELKTGDKVAVFGTENSDNTITAQNVQINPLFRSRAQLESSPQPSPTP